MKHTPDEDHIKRVLREDLDSNLEKAKSSSIFGVLADMGKSREYLESVRSHTMKNQREMIRLLRMPPRDRIIEVFSRNKEALPKEGLLVLQYLVFNQDQKALECFSSMGPVPGHPALNFDHFLWSDIKGLV